LLQSIHQSLRRKFLSFLIGAAGDFGRMEDDALLRFEIKLQIFEGRTWIEPDGESTALPASEADVLTGQLHMVFFTFDGEACTTTCRGVVPRPAILPTGCYV
jgi:hypothetical protein